MAIIIIHSSSTVCSAGSIFADSLFIVAHIACGGGGGGGGGVDCGFYLAYSLFVFDTCFATQYLVSFLVLYKYCKPGNFRDNFIFANSVKIHICDAKIATRTCFTYISKRQSDFGISRGFYFHETSHRRSFAKINPRKNFRIYSNQLAKEERECCFTLCSWCHVTINVQCLFLPHGAASWLSVRDRGIYWP